MAGDGVDRAIDGLCLSVVVDCRRSAMRLSNSLRLDVELVGGRSVRLPSDNRPGVCDRDCDGFAVLGVPGVCPDRLGEIVLVGMLYR